MTSPFEYVVTEAWTEIRLVGTSGVIQVDLWAIDGPEAAQPGVDLVNRLVGAGVAIAEANVAMLDHPAVAGLSTAEARRLGLPAAANVVIDIRFDANMTAPGAKVRLSWKRPTGQNIVGVERTGAWLRFGDAWYRLPQTLFDIAVKVDKVNAAGDEVGERLAALAELTETLPQAHADGVANPTGLARVLTVAVADSFSLDLRGEGHAARLFPVLHRTSANLNQPMLDPSQQEIFGDVLFNRFSTVRATYTLPGNTWVVLTPPLRKALEVVRSVQSAPVATKQKLLRSPRAFLREALGDDTDDTVLETLFRETTEYSERVIGLGLWQPRVVPWVPLAATDWLGGETAPASGGGTATSQGQRGLVIGDRCVPLDPAQADDLRARVETAIGAGTPSVDLEVGDETIQVPATHETLAALQKLEASRMPPAEKPVPNASVEHTAVLIHTNEQAVDVEASFKPRPAGAPGVPRAVATKLKAHQQDGLSWLQQAWKAGAPGVLLADDMGLGKTLQALAFIAWLREGMQAGDIEPAPILIVAPTGLLENWLKEHSDHLLQPGLGTCLRAYGRALAALRRTGQDGQPVLDTNTIMAADWVLTTYETLRDHDRDFGLIRFAAIIFDEAQKIKNPGVRITDAAKGMNADFRVAMTGTPVENRLSDLWCIVDGVHPGFLDDLKTFSRRYEASLDPDALAGLKRDLERSIGRQPPLLMRRMKYDHLRDLPSHTEVRHETPMPRHQVDAYRAVLANARNADRRGAVLEALQGLRGVSLHPGFADGQPDAEFIAASARLIATMNILDEIKPKGERVLIFVEDLSLQPRLARVIQRRYGLGALPILINGQVTGAERQRRVNRFQQADHGFDVMILSARAGGVGLTLTGANHVIHLSRWWNPAVEDQCNGRVLRIGQTRPVVIHLPLAVLPAGGRSFDLNLQALLERKRALMRAALVPTEENDRDHREVLDACMGE